MNDKILAFGKYLAIGSLVLDLTTIHLCHVHPEHFSTSSSESTITAIASGVSQSQDVLDLVGLVSTLAK
jgi:hypothetical protein